MKLTLSQQELEAAVRNYVTGMISLQPGTDIAVDFKAGRGDNGFTAEVDINYLSVTSISAIQTSIAATAIAATASDKAPPIVLAVQPNMASAITTTSHTPRKGETAVAKQAETQEPDPAAKVTETRKVTGKSLFGDVTKGAASTGQVGTEEPASNDSEAADDAAAEVPATSGRKTLFSEAAAG